MGTHLILGLIALAQANVATPAVAPPPPPKVPPIVADTAPTPPATAPILRCDARPWQHLVGRTISDLLTISLPPNARVYRLDDPPVAALAPGRLSIELNRSTRVRRVYCS